ncbi:MAG: hypothetical protein PHR52_00550 [Fermentimonas sp.]|nr:hypothetical protein [Fermentimonas sp.]MDD4696004.1 hypothetical protein [Fermentimonas sp.]
MKLRVLFFLAALLSMASCKKESVVIRVTPNASERVQFGAEKLKKTLEESKYKVVISETAAVDLEDNSGKIFWILEKEDSLTSIITEQLGFSLPEKINSEGFYIDTENNRTLVYAEDPSGALYGCYELSDIIREGKPLPVKFLDAPEMVMRGACIGLQKPYYLPGRTVYEYPYTPETFPWFYDKELWIEYLDMLVENRMNSLYLWNGHPFASLVKLDDYPFAVEVDDETFKKNEEIFSFLTEEADKRGIYVIQMFYNIIVSKPFAEHYGIQTQDRNRPIMPIIADYTQKSIAAFVEKYPNVGLLVCLGEAMATYEDDVNWFVNTVIPGVRDGLSATGRTDEPPIIVRAHDTDAKMVMDAALPIYSNLYTMHKYNGESLTTYEPRGPWSQIHRDLSSLGSVHIDNVHILANLEPFRYGSPDFIQKSVQAMHEVHGANGLHLYPQASYWDWPYTADKLPNGDRLKQTDRDWIWYKAWARYAWKADRDRTDEISYWSNQFDKLYGSGNGSADILEAYEQTGEISPKLLRRFGITEGNRQTLTLGMFMSQLVNPYKYKIYPGFYESCGPEGEKLIEYVEKKWKNIPHIGELPLDIVTEVAEHGDLAVEAIDRAEKSVTKNRDEFLRLKNDVYSYREFAWFFNTKVRAAEKVLDYQYSKDLKYLEEAIPLMEESLDHYRRLVELTKDTYHYANSMQTAQRRVPIGGDDGKNKTWGELLPHYEQELNNLKENIQLLKSDNQESSEVEITPLVPAEVTIINPKSEQVVLSKGQKIQSGNESIIEEIAPELKNLKALKLNPVTQKNDGTTIEFETADSVKLLIGYFRDDQSAYAKAPTLETDASANLYGQADPVLLNAVQLSGMPALNVHIYTFSQGKHTLNLGKGALLVLGFTTSDVSARNAGLTDDESSETVDWLFY